MIPRTALALLALSLAACGQKGPLYMPDTTQGEVVTRPSQTPPADGTSTAPSNPPSTPGDESKDPESKDKGKKQPPK